MSHPKIRKKSKDKKIFFLAGFPRAGNTLLTSILNQNPDICCTPNSLTLEIYKEIFLLKKTDVFLNYPDHGVASIFGFRNYGTFNNKNLVMGFEYARLAQSSFWEKRSTPNWYGNPIFGYSTYDGRRWAAHSGSDSDDLYIYFGYQSDKYSFIPSLNYERHGILFNRGGSPSTSATGMNFYDDDHKVAYHWNDAGNTYLYSGGAVVPDQTWTMLAVSVSSSAANLYTCNSNGITVATNTVSHSSATFSNFMIGRDTPDGGRYFKGDIFVLFKI